MVAVGDRDEVDRNQREGSIGLDPEYMEVVSLDIVVSKGQRSLRVSSSSCCRYD